jgi:uncharacterized membrane protein
MKERWPAYLRGVLVGAATLAYYLLAHQASAAQSASLAGAFLALAPFVAVVLALSWRSAYRRALAAAGVVLLAAFALAWPRLQAHPSWLYFLQNVAGNVLLAFVFGRSLCGGRQALVTYVASFTHRPTMSPLVARYTRQVTAAWTVFFVFMACASTLLFALAPVESWSVFANLLSLPLVIGMFLGEYLVRRCVVPAHERTSIIGSIRAYRFSLAKSTAATEESR